MFNTTWPQDQNDQRERVLRRLKEELRRQEEILRDVRERFDYYGKEIRQLKERIISFSRLPGIIGKLSLKKYFIKKHLIMFDVDQFRRRFGFW